MSDVSQGPGWWQASDGKWYPPESHPTAAVPPPPPVFPAPTTNAAPDPAQGPTPLVVVPKKPWWRRWWVISAAVVLLIAVIGAVAGGGSDEDADAPTQPGINSTIPGERPSPASTMGWSPTTEVATAGTPEAAATEPPSTRPTTEPQSTEPPGTEPPGTEPATTPPAPPAIGVSLSAPALVGEAVPVGDWIIRVSSVTPDAAAAVAAENSFNEPPAEGKQFFMATLEATYVGSESATFWVDLTLKAVGASNVAYESYEADCGVVPSEIDNAGETFPGGTITGNACWAVDAADAASLTMIAEPSFSFDSDTRRFLSMDPSTPPVEGSTAAEAPVAQGVQGVPIGEALAVGDWTIKVVGVAPDAAAEVAAENSFNEPPAEGHQFFMATLEATYTGTESSTFWIDTTLKAVGASSVAYEAFQADCGVIPNEIDDAGETFPGGTISGNVCWAVATGDVATLTMLADASFSFDNAGRQAFSLVPQG